MTVYGIDTSKILHRDSDYLKYIKTMRPCPHCGGPSDPHHVGRGGMGIKGSDYVIANICRKLHILCTGPYYGEKRVQDDFGLDFQQMAIENLISYIMYLKCKIS